MKTNQNHHISTPWPAARSVTRLRRINQLVVVAGIKVLGAAGPCVFSAFHAAAGDLLIKTGGRKMNFPFSEEVWVNDMTLDGNNNQTLEKIHPPGFESWPFLADSTLSHGSHVKQRPVAVSLDNFSIKIRHSPDE